MTKYPYATQEKISLGIKPVTSHQNTETRSDHSAMKKGQNKTRTLLILIFNLRTNLSIIIITFFILICIVQRKLTPNYKILFCFTCGLLFKFNTGNWTFRAYDFDQSIGRILPKFPVIVHHILKQKKIIWLIFLKQQI